MPKFAPIKSSWWSGPGLWCPNAETSQSTTY
jgi:hypothetical protein